MVFSIIPFFEEEKKNKNEEYLNGITLKYFKKACSLFKDIYFKQLDKSYLHPKLVLLYSIAFIKMYLFYYVEYNRENNNQVNFLDINDVIAADHNSTGKTIQLYTLKLLRTYFPSYEDFKNYPWTIHQMKWVENFEFEEKVKSNSIFDFLLISLKEKYTFIKMNTLFERLFFDNFNNENKEFNNLLKEKDKSVFIDIIINKILSKLYNNDYSASPQFQHFTNLFIHPLINNNDIFSQSSKKLLSLFETRDKISEQLLNNQPLSIHQLEIILYSFKIVFNCSEANDNSFYKQFFSNNIIQ